MRTTFQHHYDLPPKDAVNEALIKATVVLDTNILLGLYRVSPELRETRLSVLRKIGSRLFVPHQVGVEFHRNRREVVQDIRTEYSALEAVIGTLSKAVKQFGGENRYAESAKQVRDLVEPALAQILDGLKELAKEDAHLIDLRQDPVLDALEELLEGRIGKAPSPKKLARRVQEFIAVRVPLSLPPGYADTGKIENRGPAAAAGDYLLWREVLTMAKRNDTDVVLITDETKPDWWSIGGNRLPTVPHPLLVSEFREKTGRNYYQLRSQDLLKLASVLDVTVSDDDLAEEEELYAARAERAALANLALVSAFASEERSARALAALRANMSELNTLAFSESTRSSLASAMSELSSPGVPPSVLGALAADMRNLTPDIPPSVLGALAADMRNLTPGISPSVLRDIAATMRKFPHNPTQEAGSEPKSRDADDDSDTATDGDL
ncbi:PIN-like domain-containing protein [Oerskovia enterophila]|uniref:PIN-like domain-containing protein n=1 Tax=Oerskovia enterophila TaxID=43678 RepID=UPI0037F3F2FB